MTEAEMWEAAERVMTANQHLAFWLHHHEGLPRRVIAAALGVSRQAVDDRIVKGTARLVAEKARLELEEEAA